MGARPGSRGCARSVRIRLLEPIAEAAIFQRFNRKRNIWVDVDPPSQLVRMVLTRERRWAFPRISWGHHHPDPASGRIAIGNAGIRLHDPSSICAEFALPPIPERPSKEQARAALDRLIDLISEFSFSDRDGHEAAQPFGRAIRAADRAGARGASDCARASRARRHSWNRERAI